MAAQPGGSARRATWCGPGGGINSCDKTAMESGLFRSVPQVSRPASRSGQWSDEATAAQRRQRDSLKEPANDRGPRGAREPERRCATSQGRTRCHAIPRRRNGRRQAPSSCRALAHQCATKGGGESAPARQRAPRPAPWAATESWPPRNSGAEPRVERRRRRRNVRRSPSSFNTGQPPCPSPRHDAARDRAVAIAHVGNRATAAGSSYCCGALVAFAE